jgi:hypothetical protein
MAEKKAVEVIVGKKEGKATEEGKVQTTPPKQEVGGREHWATIECPHCWALNDVIESDYYNYWYTCWRCHLPFYC